MRKAVGITVTTAIGRSESCRDNSFRFVGGAEVEAEAEAESGFRFVGVFFAGVRNSSTCGVHDDTATRDKICEKDDAST